MPDVEEIDLAKATPAQETQSADPEDGSGIDLSKATAYNPRSISQSGGQDRFLSTESQRSSWAKPITLVEAAYRMFDDLQPINIGAKAGEAAAKEEFQPNGKKTVVDAAGEAAQDLSSFAKYGVQGILSDAENALNNPGGKVGSKLIPFSPTGAIQSLSLMNKVKALQADKYEDPSQKERDKQAVQDYLVQMEEMNFRNYTVGGKIFKMSAESATFAAEFMMTDGVGAIAKKATYKSLVNATELAAEEGAKRFALKIAANTAAGLAQTPLVPQRIVAGYAERQIFANATLTDKGIQVLKESNEKPFTSLYKAVMDTAIENITEHFGTFFFKPFEKAVEAVGSKVLPAQLVSSVLRAYQEAFPKNNVGKILREFGYNGVLEEMGEERLGDIFKVVTGVDPGKPGNNMLQNIVQSFPDAEGWLVEAGVFSLPMVTNAATAKAFDMIEKKNPKMTKEEVSDVVAGMSQTEKEAFVDDEKAKNEALATAFEKQQAAADEETVNEKGQPEDEAVQENKFYHVTDAESVKGIEEKGFESRVGERSLGATRGKGVFLYESEEPTKEFSKNFKNPAVLETSVKGKIFDAIDNDLSIRALAEDEKLVSKLKKEGYVGIRGDELGTPVTFIFNPEAIKSKSTPQAEETETVKGLSDTYKEMDTARVKRRLEGMKDQEQAGKMAKGAGMQRSAIVRALNGEPTGREVDKAIEKLNGNYIGKLVKTPDGEAVVSGGSSFGRVKVRYENGEEKYVPSEDVKSKQATKEEAIEHLKREAEKAARLELSVMGVPLEKQPKDIQNTEKEKAKPEPEPEVKKEEKPKRKIAAKKPVKGEFETDEMGTESFEDTQFFETERKQSRLGLGVEAAAVEEGLTERFSGLPEYRTVNMADQARRVQQILESDPEGAVEMALGKERPPKGVLPESVFTAVEKQALRDGNAELLQRLATGSKLITEASQMGQRIRALAERSPYSAVSAMQRANDNLEQNYETENEVPAEKAKAETVKEIKAEIEKTKPKAKDWASFIEEIRCK